MNRMSVVLLAFLLLVAAFSPTESVPQLGCTHSDEVMIRHVQDVSPDMTPFIDLMKSGALQEFSDWVDSNFAGRHSSSLVSFTDKLDVCYKLERYWKTDPIVPAYNDMPTNVGSNTPLRGVMDAVLTVADSYWGSSTAYPKVMIVYTNKEPRYPPTAGFLPFDPNDIDCTKYDTPSMAELTTFMTSNNRRVPTHVSVVFVVPSSLVASYKSAFGWLGSRLSVVPSGYNKASLLNEGLYPAMNDIVCSVPPPPTCAKSTFLQLLHLQDFSLSYTNDMDNLKAKMPALLAGLKAEFFVSQVALGTFVDKPIAESGYDTDYCYHEDAVFSTDASLLINALNEATPGSGRDWRESQYDAIRDGVQSKTLGWWSGISVPGGIPLLRVVMLVTDSAPHTKGDQGGLPSISANGCAFADYPSHADIKALLETNDVYPIFVVTDDVYDYYNNLLGYKINTMGKVLRLADTVTDIVDSIKIGLEEICNYSRRPTP